MRKIISSALSAALVLTAAPPLRAERGMEEFFLFGMENPALLTRLDKGLTPASVTTITADDIRLTPARNIYDLMEVYVPGTMWYSHNESPHPSIRGLSSDRDTKILLLVNGIKINQDAFSGAVDELSNWDLNDIKEIQIIRGPGSVTYGPGAIMGVINIVTFDAKTAARSAFGFAATPSPYGNHTAYAGLTRNGDALGIYGYASASKTRGYATRTFDAVTPNIGWIGQHPTGTFSDPAIGLFRSWRDNPDVKAHLGMDFLKEWKFTARYNSSGMVMDPLSTKERFVAAATTTPFAYERQMLNRYFLAVLENNHAFSNTMRLKTRAGWRTYDHLKGLTAPATAPTTTSVDDSRNFDNAFGANHFFADLLYNLTFLEKHEIAFGGGGEKEYVNAGWDRPSQEALWGDNNTEFVSGPDDRTISAVTRYIGKGWKAYRYHALSELNLKFDPKLTLILSGRADRHKFTNTLLSPRLAILSDLEGAGVFKLILQKALRVEDSTELLIDHLNKEKSAPEELRSAELIWNNPGESATGLSVATFYNKGELLGFTNLAAPAGGAIRKMGTLSWAGVELEAKRQSGKLTWGGSHSYVDMIDFKGTPEAFRSNLFTYSDVNVTNGGIVLNGVGNNLNHWSNHTTKLFANWKTREDRLTFHGNARVYWGFEGKKDGLTMYANGSQGAGATAAFNRAAIDAYNAHGAYDIQVRVNASVAYKITDPFSVTVFGMNLVAPRQNLRYTVDPALGGNANPIRSEFTEEPLMVGFRMDYRLN